MAAGGHVCLGPSYDFLGWAHTDLIHAFFERLLSSPTSKPRPNHTWFLPLPGHQGVRLPPSEAETMGNKNPPDERVVYLALKNIFKGPSAEVRQPKAIRKLIGRSRHQEDVADLIKAHNIDTICNTARTLLTEQHLRRRSAFRRCSMCLQSRAQRGRRPRLRLPGTRQMQSKTPCMAPRSTLGM